MPEVERQLSLMLSRNAQFFSMLMISSVSEYFLVQVLKLFVTQAGRDLEELDPELYLILALTLGLQVDLVLAMKVQLL